VDVWKWIPDPVVGYTVSGEYRLLTARPPLTVHVPRLFYGGRKFL